MSRTQRNSTITNVNGSTVLKHIKIDPHGRHSTLAPNTNHSKGTLEQSPCIITIKHYNHLTHSVNYHPLPIQFFDWQQKLTTPLLSKPLTYPTSIKCSLS